MIDISNSITQYLKVLLYLQQSLSIPHFLNSSPTSNTHIIHFFQPKTYLQFIYINVMNQFSSEGLWWAQSAEPNTSSKYKGVVPQPNGRWGAQIYENNHRLWLGTFDSQEAAAMSYDRAASMFRGSDATLNFLHHPHHVSSSPSHEMEVEEEETVEEEEDEREHMFEKPLTPSDVGKLNRLVIPKQYAEKYFPIGGSDSVDKGLLLSFEDEAGKVWRFRYSYWNSSQSYVLTKGWSRFVKEKQLDAGDVVWFERKMINNQHMLIRWRRRVPPPSAQVVVTTSSPTNLQSQSNSNSAAAWTNGYYPAEAYPSHHYHHLHGSLLYQPDCLHAAVEPPVVIQNPTTVAGNSKRLRLFGVNLDCQLDEPAGHEDGSYDFLSSNQAQTHYFTNASSYNYYKESNFSRDQTEDDRGRDPSM